MKSIAIEQRGTGQDTGMELTQLMQFFHCWLSPTASIQVQLESWDFSVKEYGYAHFSYRLPGITTWYHSKQSVNNRAYVLIKHVILIQHKDHYLLLDINCSMKIKKNNLYFLVISMEQSKSLYFFINSKCSYDIFIRLNCKLLSLTLFELNIFYIKILLRNI